VAQVEAGLTEAVEVKLVKIRCWAVLEYMVEMRCTATRPRMATMERATLVRAGGVVYALG
jgi:hypothetical protein